MARTVDKEGTRKRREQILRAAGECFSKKGFHKTTMAEICKKAGLSPGAVYHYFKSKDDIIVSLAQRDLDESRQFAEAIESTGTVEELVAVAVDLILEHSGYDDLQLYLEVLCEGGRNEKVGKLLIESETLVFKTLEKQLTKLGAVNGGERADMLAAYVGTQVVALEIFMTEKPSAEECAEMSRLSKKALRHVLLDR